MLRILLTYLFVALAFSGISQQTQDSVIITSVIKEPIVEIRNQYEQISYKGRIRYYNFDYDLFPSIREGVTSHSSFKPLTQTGYRTYQAITSKQTNWRPLADFNGFGRGVSGNDFGFGYRSGAGVSWNGHFKDQWNFHLAGVGGIYDGDESYQPQSYFNWGDGATRLYGDVRSRISFSPNKIFNFQAGIDHNFIGEGSRSLFISDYGNPYPFGLVRANFWRVEYSVLYQFMREGTPGNYEGKFASSHHISFNAADWLNFGIFETVIFNPADTLLGRGFDVEYLNPIVFYRPQEYSVGSADNVLLGIDATGRYKNYTIYSQFVVDEFVVNEVLRERSQWWANKFGGQLGVKANYKVGKHHFFARTEINFVRPYTYAHLNDKLNHGNQGSALAHPYGANFTELLAEVRWAKHKWRGHFFVSYAQRGGDTDSFNYGADIYLPYVNRPYEYGHFLGQGDATNTWFFRWRIAYKLEKLYSASAFMEYNLRYTVQQQNIQNLVSVGIRTNLWNDYRNY